jgi:hypothetical protein
MCINIIPTAPWSPWWNEVHQTCPGVFSSPPAPPRKTSTTYPKMSPHQDLLITNALTQDPGADSLSRPHLRVNYTDLVEDSCRDEYETTCLRRQEHASKALLSSSGKQRPRVSHTKRNPTYVRGMVSITHAHFWSTNFWSRRGGGFKVP